jgi:hypothetical protein
MIGMALGQQLLGHFAVARCARMLRNRLAIPGQTQPRHAGDDGVDGRIG